MEWLKQIYLSDENVCFFAFTISDEFNSFSAAQIGCVCVCVWWEKCVGFRDLVQLRPKAHFE